jgi:hypothetical protein
MQSIPQKVLFRQPSEETSWLSVQMLVMDKNRQVCCQLVPSRLVVGKIMWGTRLDPRGQEIANAQSNTEAIEGSETQTNQDCFAAGEQSPCSEGWSQRSTK